VVSVHWKTAEQFGNSESIIKKHYPGRVSRADTKKFYALRPTPAKAAQRKPATSEKPPAEPRTTAVSSGWPTRSYSGEE
jgi:hypothetical protein